MGDVDGATRDKVLTSLSLDTFIALEQDWSLGAVCPVQSCQASKPGQFSHSVRDGARSPEGNPELMKTLSPMKTGAEASFRGAGPSDQPVSNF